MRRTKKKQEWRATCKKLDGENTRKKILDAAIVAAREKGIHNITAVLVASIAGVSHTSIIYYFGGITELKKEVSLCLERL